jgi:iron complex outermembrane receptor protein
VIEGRVTDTDGRPLPGTGITIENTFLGVHADSDGFYSFTGLKDGNYELRFSFVGYESKSVRVVLNDRAIRNVTLAAKTFLTDDVIVNATRAGEHTPLAYSTISKELLKKQNNGHDLPYLLSLTPSLVETSEAGNGVGYTSLRIRGTEGSRINVTIDGIPLNDPESQQVFWVDLPDLASSVENIQIQRGAGTSSNGAGAFGATISIETSNPDSEPLAEISTSAGSFNTYKNMISASTGLLAGKFAVQMRYSDLRSDGYIERTGSDHRSAYISSVYRSDRSRLKANIILGEEHTGIGWWGVPGDMLSVNRRYNPAGEYTDQKGNKRYYENETDNYIQNHYQLIYSLKLNNKLNVNTALHYTKGEGYYEEFRNAQSLTDYGLPIISIGDSVISVTDLVRRKWMSNDFYGLVYSLKYKDKRVEAVFGGGTNIFYGDHYGKVIWMRNAGSSEKDYNWYLNNAIKSEANIYGKVNYSLSDRTTIFGDVQYRHVFYNMTGIDSDMKDLSQEHRFNFLNPKAGVFFSITPDQDAYLSFSVANREPTRSDFKEAAGDQTATPKPETLYDTELGYKLRTNISSFAINLYSMIYKDQLVPTGQLSDVGYSIMTNVKNSYRMGVELSAGIKASKIIAWNMNLTLSRNKIADFTEYYVDYNTNDWSSVYLNKNLGEVDIAYSPAVIGTSDVIVSVIPKVDFHFISKYVGKQYFDNTMSSDRMIDPYFVNNIRLDYAPEVKNIKGLEFQILVNNIFNESYESNAYGGNWYEDGQEKTWSYYFPQAGINYMFKAGITF